MSKIPPTLPPLPARPKLSVIVPAYNERATARIALDAITAKRIAGWEIEVIIVESNSTDGTREIVNSYAALPHVSAGAHASGEARYAADEPALAGELFLVPVMPGVAHARIDAIDASAALAMDGSVRVFTARDVLGASTSCACGR